MYFVPWHHRHPLLPAGTRTAYLFNTHNAVKHIATVIGGSFSLVFLYRLGIPMSYLLFSLAGVFVARFVFRLMLFPLLRSIGLKVGMLFGQWLYPIRYLALIPVTGMDQWFFLFLALFALSEAVYITCFHAYWAAISDNKNGAAELGIREAIIQIAGILGAVGSGYALSTYGPWSSFLVSAVLAVVATIPLFFMANIKAESIRQSHTMRSTKDMRRVYRLLFAEGFQAAGWYHMWPLIVFVVVGSDFFPFGQLLGLVCLMQALGWYFIGHRLSRIDKRILAILGTIAMLAVTVGRFFYGWSVPSIIALDAFAVIAFLLYQPLLGSTAYEIIRNSRSVLTASVWHEFGWETGAVTTLAITGILVSLGHDIHIGLLVGAAGLVLCGYTLFMYHHRQAS